MSRLSLWMLGPFRAALEGEPLTDFRTRKVQALLVYLVTEPRAHRREQLLELLWPGLPDKSARSNLRQIIYYLRQTIPETGQDPGDDLPLIIASRQDIQLNPQANVRTDTGLFQTLLSKTTDHDHVDIHLCRDCRQSLERAVNLYRGDFLVDFYLDDSNEFEEWSQARRTLYRRQVLDALAVLATSSTHQRQYADAQRYAERQLEIDNLREGAYRQLMKALALSGRREQAVAVYEACRRVLAEELAMAPTARTTEIYEKIIDGDVHFDMFASRGVRGYELLEQIGEGSHATIHRAIQTGIGRPVAVKVIRREHANDAQFIRRFEAEAQIVARLEHPHIVPLYDYWRDPEGAYLVMRYMQHGSLLTALQAGPWPLERASILVGQVAGALSVAHRNNVVHRDLKPANILLDEAGNAYLSDFGIARDLNRDLQITGDNAFLGTLDYTSPEQILNEAVTPQSDIYSLGAVVYELLTGERPFAQTSLSELIHQQLHTPMPLVSASCPDIMIEIDEVLQKATAKKPADRYSDVLHMATAFEEALRGARPALTPALRPVPLPADVHNPYKGLRAFQEVDAEDFFGREELVQRLLDRLAAPANGRDSRFMAIVGPSGSGKSSVVKAGLIPALRAGALQGSQDWFFAEMTPGAQPLEQLELALWPVAVDPPPTLIEPMARDTRGILRTIRRILPDAPGAQLLLVIDQFEELFTLVEDAELRAFFLDSLLVALRAPQSSLRVVITLRADFYDRPLQLQDWGQLLKENTEIALPLNHSELTWAIREPARRVGVNLEEGLTTAIVADVAEQPGALPLLQFAMTELFELRAGHQITHRAYEQIGGVRGALGKHAETLYQELNREAQKTARQLFLRLVTLGEGVEDTRRRAPVVELEMLSEQSIVQAVLDSFGAARLLTFDRDPLTRLPTVEVAHEALLREWPRLRRWLDESRADVRLQRLLAAATGEWLTAAKDPGFLLRGARMDQFEAWTNEASVVLTGAEQAFLDASLAARHERRAEEEARRQRELQTARDLANEQSRRAEVESRAARNLRRLVGALALALLVALAAAWFANTQRTVAQENFLASERIRLASQAQNVLDRGEGADLAALLALRSLQLGNTPEADAALLNALARGFSRQQFVGHDDLISSGEFSPDGRFILTSSIDGSARLWRAQTGQEVRQYAGHRGSVGTARFSPDGRTIMTAGSDGTARIWDTETARELHRLTHDDVVWAVGVSPDNRYALTSAGAVLYLWDLATGAQVRQMLGHTDNIFMAAFSPDGRTLASASVDGTARLWETESGEELQQFLGHTSWIGWLDFSSDGRYLVTSSGDHTARVWVVETGMELRRLVGHSEDLMMAELSPDGKLAATASTDKTARLWDVATGREVRRFLGHTSGVTVLSFSPDGRHLMSAGEDGSARLWDVESESEPRTLISFAGTHNAFQTAAAISPDGQLALTDQGGDGTVRLWDMESSKLLRKISLLGSTANHLVFSPDGSLALASSSNDNAYLIEVQLEQEPVPLRGHDGNVFAGAFSADGRQVVTGGEDGTARMWDVMAATEVRRFTGHTGPVRSVAFSPDGSQILSGGDDQMVILWQTDTGEEIHRFAGQNGSVLAADFAPDGQSVVTGYDDHTAILWDVEQGRVLQRFIGHTERVTQVAFTPDGQYVLTGSADQTARLWDASSGELARQYSGHESPLLSLGFSQDGQRIYTTDRGNVYAWRVTLADAMAYACQQLGRDFTAEERAFYDIDGDDPTCQSQVQQVAQAQPTWTPIAPEAVEAGPISLVTEIEFSSEAFNITMGVPVQDVFVDIGKGKVARPWVLDEETMAMPVYRTVVEVPQDFLEEPFDDGPYPKGEPLGFTLGDYVAAEGYGTYTVEGSRAKVEMTFDHLVPNGVYSFWCNVLSFTELFIEEYPCVAPDGTPYTFVAGADGHAEVTMELAAFPASTDQALYEIGVAYHSDGQTHGDVVGEHGLNAHGQLFYDFLPPEE